MENTSFVTVRQAAENLKHKQLSNSQVYLYLVLCHQTAITLVIHIFGIYEYF